MSQSEVEFEFKLKSYLMQKPSIGRIVTFYPVDENSHLSRNVRSRTDGSKAAALITIVHSDGACDLNVMVSDVDTPVICIRNVPHKNDAGARSYWDWPEKI